MRIARRLATLVMTCLSGYRRKADTKPNQTDVSSDRDLDEFYQKAVAVGYTYVSPGQSGRPTIVEIANIKLLYANYKSSQKLRAAIERFDKSSAVLGTRMLVLTVAMLVLTIVIAYLTFVQVSDRIGAPTVRLHEKSSSLADVLLHPSAETQTGLTLPVEQNGQGKAVQNEIESPSEGTAEGQSLFSYDC